MFEGIVAAAASTYAQYAEQKRKQRSQLDDFAAIVEQAREERILDAAAEIQVVSGVPFIDALVAARAAAVLTDADDSRTIAIGSLQSSTSASAKLQALELYRAGIIDEATLHRYLAV